MRYLPVLGAIALVVAAIGAATSSNAAAGSATVTNSNDAGAGSFRAAIELANGNSAIGTVVFAGNLEPIELQSTVLYDGSQSLTIVGNRAVVDATDLTGTSQDPSDAFRAETPGDLSVIGLTIANAAGEGIEYQVPPESGSGTKHVSLNGVRVFGGDPEDGRGGHGVVINDQRFPDESGNTDVTPPIPPNPAGSAASLDVSVLNCEFDGNGFDELDRDGLRVNEGGVGDLTIVIRNTLATDNGADGIELDERGDGNVYFTVSGSQITGNGSFHDLFPPTPPEPVDLDDGMDVDESNAGAVIGRVTNSASNDNFEEGWDFNENDAGDFLVDLTNVQASRNPEEGVDFEEDDDFAGGGDLVTTVIGLTADENGGDGGLKVREKGDGNLAADVRGARANGNNLDGINVREDAAGNLAATIERSTANENGNDGIEFEENGTGNQNAAVERSTTDANGQDGVEFDENGDGNLTGAVSRGSSSSNAASGARADQAGSGPLNVGTLHLASMTLGGYPPGVALIAVGVTVTQTP